MSYTFHHQDIDSGTIVDVTIPSVSRDFTFKTKVIWCHSSETGIFTIGVAFLEGDVDFNTRMVDLVCRIDRYRARALAKGRRLTFEAAAAEWIKKFAKILPA